MRLKPSHKRPSEPGTCKLLMYTHSVSVHGRNELFTFPLPFDIILLGNASKLIKYCSNYSLYWWVVKLKSPFPQAGRA